MGKSWGLKCSCPSNVGTNPTYIEGMEKASGLLEEKPVIFQSDGEDLTESRNKCPLDFNTRSRN